MKIYLVTVSSVFFPSFYRFVSCRGVRFFSIFLSYLFYSARVSSIFSSFLYYRFTEIWWTATEYHDPRWPGCYFVLWCRESANVQGNWNAIFLLRIFFWFVVVLNGRVFPSWGGKWMVYVVYTPTRFIFFDRAVMIMMV